MYLELNDYSILEGLIEPFTAGRMTIVVIPTNARAVYGAGVAKLIRNGLPEMEHLAGDVFSVFPSYLEANKLQLFYTNHPNIMLMALPTKDHFKDAARMRNIVSGIIQLRTFVSGYASTIIMPKIGSGLGGLDWWPIRDYLYQTFGELLDNDVFVVDSVVNPDQVVAGLGVDRKVLAHVIYQQSSDIRYGSQHPKFTILWGGLTHEGVEEYINGYCLRSGRKVVVSPHSDIQTTGLAVKLGSNNYRFSQSAISMLVDKSTPFSMSQVLFTP